MMPGLQVLDIGLCFLSCLLSPDSCFLSKEYSLPVTKVTKEAGEGWSLLELSTPSGLNRLGTETLKSLYAELTAALSGGCRCLAIVGRGKSFAVGADLREMGQMGSREAREFSDLGNCIFRLIESSEAVVVAGIDGFCLGGGLDLALSADWRLATDRSLFGHPGVDLGIVTGFGGTQRLPRLIGRHRAAIWLFTGARIRAAEAYKEGVIQEVCSPAAFQDSLRTRIEQFAVRPVQWISGVKYSLRYGSEGWRGNAGT
jgi:enoyl-CoA hydratase